MIDKEFLVTLLDKIACGTNLSLDESAISVTPFWQICGYSSIEEHVTVIKHLSYKQS